MSKVATPIHLIASKISLAGEWERNSQVDEVLLDFNQRHRRRTVMVTVSGAEILMDLSRAIRLKEGDGLCLDNGGIVGVRARPEPLLEIHSHGASELVRIAWHLGNRHLPVQLLGSRIRIRDDHVIAAMVEGLGGHVARIEAPFDPEAGAYAPGGGHSHAHDDDDHHHHTHG